jgi:hypothetical protein
MNGIGGNLDWFVTAGDLLRAGPWNAAMRLIRSLRLVGGFGVRLRTLPDGTIINFDGRWNTFDHAWRCQLIGESGASINPGTINKIMGKIDDGSGNLTRLDDATKPILDWSKDGIKLDKDGIGWIAAEVECSELDWSVAEVKMVQVSDLDTDDGLAPKDESASGSSAGGVPNLPGRRARFAVAMLRNQKQTGLQITPCAHFNQTHRVYTTFGQDPKKDAAWHFFFPEQG